MIVALLTGRRNNLAPIVEDDGQSRVLRTSEVEKMFGMPQSYTDVGLSATRRQKLLGASWCVATIKALLWPLKFLYAAVPGRETER